MLDVQPVDRVQFKPHHTATSMGTTMADESDNPDGAADRLETALERIAFQLARQIPPDAVLPRAGPSEAAAPPEIAQRLDILIDRLKAEIG
jgi:hypothetical protein